MKRQRHTAVLVIDFVINTLLTIVELVAAVISGSVALRADGFQNLTDSLVLTVAYIGEKLAFRPGLAKRVAPRIYRRVRVTNSLILMSLSIYTGISSYQRIMNPRDINGLFVVVIGLFGIAINLIAAALLYRSRHDRATEAPYVGLLFSGLSGLGVCVAGAGAMYWRLDRIDGIVGVVLALLLFVRSSRMLLAAQHIRAPKRLRVLTR